MYQYQYYEQVCDNAKNLRTKNHSMNAAISHLCNMGYKQIPNWMAEWKRLSKKQLEILESTTQKPKRSHKTSKDIDFVDNDLSEINL